MPAVADSQTELNEKAQHTVARIKAVIGQVDVTTPEAARHMMNETDRHGVSIGRGAFYDPWIFRRTIPVN